MDASALVDVVSLSETASEASTDDVRPMPESSEDSPVAPAEHEAEEQEAEKTATEHVSDDVDAADNDDVEAVERDADWRWREVDWCVLATTEPGDMDEADIGRFFAWLAGELTRAFADRPPPLPLNERPRRPGDASSVVFRQYEEGGAAEAEQQQLVYWAPSGDADALRARYETLQRERPGVMVVFHLLPEANTNDYELMKTLSLEFGFVRQGILVQNARNRFASIDKPVGEIVANIGDWITKRLFELAFGSRKQRGATFDVTFAGAGDSAAPPRSVSSLRPFTVAGEQPPAPRHRQPNPAQRVALVATALHCGRAAPADSDAAVASDDADETLRCLDVWPVPRHTTLCDMITLFHARHATVTEVRFGRLDADTGVFEVPYAAVGAFDPANPECLSEVAHEETPAARVRFQSKLEAVSVYEKLMGERVNVAGATAVVSLSCRQQCAAYFDAPGRSVRPFVYVDRRLSPPKKGKPPANRSPGKRSALAPRQ